MIPLGLLYSAGLLVHFGSEPFRLDLGLMFIPALVIFLIPLIHIFISTSRMQNDAGNPPGNVPAWTPES